MISRSMRAASALGTAARQGARRYLPTDSVVRCASTESQALGAYLNELGRRPECLDPVELAEAKAAAETVRGWENENREYLTGRAQGHSAAAHRDTLGFEHVTFHSRDALRDHMNHFAPFTIGVNEKTAFDKVTQYPVKAAAYPTPMRAPPELFNFYTTNIIAEHSPTLAKCAKTYKFHSNFASTSNLKPAK